jgi:beta-glucosidase
VLHYQEGVFCGHRWYDERALEPAFPFGHGLSYTSFAITRPTVAAAVVEAGDDVVVDVTVTNTGGRHGTEVVQLYVGDDSASVRRAPRELRGFAKVALGPGERRELRFVLGPRDLAFWDARAACWRAEAGTFTLWAGRSSRDLGEPAVVTLAGEWSAPATIPPTPVAGASA